MSHGRGERGAGGDALPRRKDFPDHEVAPELGDGDHAGERERASRDDDAQEGRRGAVRRQRPRHGEERPREKAGRDKRPRQRERRIVQAHEAGRPPDGRDHGLLARDEKVALPQQQHRQRAQHVGRLLSPRHRRPRRQRKINRTGVGAGGGGGGGFWYRADGELMEGGGAGHEGARHERADTAQQL